MATTTTTQTTPAQTQENKGASLPDRRGFLEIGLGLAGALAMPSVLVAGTTQVRSVSYTQALADVESKLNKEATGHGFTIRVASKLTTNEELNTLAGALISGAGAPPYVSQFSRMHRSGSFAEVRAEAITNGSDEFALPYINHENQVTKRYSLTQNEKNAHAGIVAAEKDSNLKILGVTPLDHQKALYAVAVKSEDGTPGWVLAKITKGSTATQQNGKGPSPTEVQSVLPGILRQVEKKAP